MERKSKKGLEIRWALLCQHSSVDAKTNALSLFNIIEELTLNRTPTNSSNESSKVKLIDLPEKALIKTNYSLVVLTEREAGVNPSLEAKLKIVLSDPSGEEIISNEFPVKFEDPSQIRNRVILGFDGMEVKKSGTYVYKIFTKVAGEKEYTEKFQAPLDVKIYP